MFAHPEAKYDGVLTDALRATCGAPQIIALADCVSTMDVAHTLAADGAQHMTVVVADHQTAGRGRTGKVWDSASDTGVWMSVILREHLDAPSGILSLRVGLEIAERLQRYADAPIRLKWPNDLFLGSAKLGGVLSEARWRGNSLDWIVVGVGINVLASTAASVPPRAALGHSIRRATVLSAITNAVGASAARVGALTDDELLRYAARDLSVGREVTAPLVGTVAGIARNGGVEIRTPLGREIAVSGSLEFREPLSEDTHAAGV
jgi:biotin-[acetyl-CoA-carboxylase] ligase BirA-like protein